MRHNSQPQRTFEGNLQLLRREMASDAMQAPRTGNDKATISYREIDTRGDEARDALCRRFGSTP